MIVKINDLKVTSPPVSYSGQRSLWDTNKTLSEAF